MDMFSDMRPLNRAALVLFVVAKACGLTGVALGFLPEHHVLGGVFLWTAAASIAASIVLSLVQAGRERQEDDVKLTIAQLTDVERRLREQVAALRRQLEEQR